MAKGKSANTTGNQLEIAVLTVLSNKGFEIPLLGWFKYELWGMINDDLLEQKFIIAQGIFNPQYIEALKKKLHSNNPEDSHATIWALIVFQHWWKKYLC